MHVLMQRLKHQSVATERHHNIGIGGILVAIERHELRQRRLRLHIGARDEGDPVISLGDGHGIAGLISKEGSGYGKVVYTTLPVLVEMTIWRLHAGAFSSEAEPGSR